MTGFELAMLLPQALECRDQRGVCFFWLWQILESKLAVSVTSPGLAAAQPVQCHGSSARVTNTAEGDGDILSTSLSPEMPASVLWGRKREGGQIGSADFTLPRAVGLSQLFLWLGAAMWLSSVQVDMSRGRIATFRVPFSLGWNVDVMVGARAATLDLKTGNLY